MTSEHSALASAKSRPDFSRGAAYAAASLALLVACWLSDFNPFVAAGASIALIFLHSWTWMYAVTLLHWNVWHDLGEPWEFEGAILQGQAFAMPNSRAALCAVGVGLITGINLIVGWTWVNAIWSAGPLRFTGSVAITILAASIAAGISELWHVAIGLGPGRRYVWQPRGLHWIFLAAGLTAAAAIAAGGLFQAAPPQDMGLLLAASMAAWACSALIGDGKIALREALHHPPHGMADLPEAATSKKEISNPAIFRRQAERKWHPPRLRPQKDTYGDARFADPQADKIAMKAALGGGEGIWYGSAVNVVANALRIDQDIAYTGDRHLLTVAPTRSGKGACAIIPNLLMQNKMSVICIDPKGQNAAVTAKHRSVGSKVFCLNPFGLHVEEPWNLSRDRFNPLAHLRIDSPNLVAEVAALAQALIVTESKTQPYFDNSARDLVKMLILHAIATKGDKATLLDMRGWLGLPTTAPTDRPSLLAVINDIHQSPHAFLRESAARFLSDARSVDEVMQSARNQTEFLSDPGIAYTLGASDFSIQDFKREVTTLYIILPDTYIDAYVRFLRLLVVSSLDGLRSRPGGTPTLVILDEFARLGHLAAVENAFALSAGYNVKVWPFVQDLTQLKQVYGDRWESLIANSGMVQWFTPNDSFTAEYLSKRIGKTTIATQSSNVSRGASFGSGSGTSSGGLMGQSSSNFSRNDSSTEQIATTTSDAAVDFMSPQDLFNLPEYFQIVTMAGFKYPILATREHYYEWEGDMKATKDQAMADPYHSVPS